MVLFHLDVSFLKSSWIIGVLLAQESLDQRLSEEVLAAAILAFYKQIHGPTLPLGIAEEVLIKWAGKMAFGLREMASRFKRLLWESPIKAKSKKIQEMKKLY